MKFWLTFTDLTQYWPFAKIICSLIKFVHVVDPQEGCKEVPIDCYV